MSKDIWMQEHERIGEDYVSGRIEREDAVLRLKQLGFDPCEIDDQISALDEDRNN